MLMTVSGGEHSRTTMTMEDLMRYLMLHFFDEDVLATMDDPATDRELTEWISDVRSSGAQLYGAALQPSSLGRTVRIREDSLLVTDGPFAETKEQVAGIDVLECASIEEAIALAARHPSARSGVLEIRQVID
jgi:hypothetical protein